MFIQDDTSNDLVHYGNFTVQRNASLRREFYITNMSTLVSNSEYIFQVCIAL